MTTLTSTTQSTEQKRLRTTLKRLVIELGYLEQCLSQGLPDRNVQTAAVRLDSAIDCLNAYLRR